MTGYNKKLKGIIPAIVTPITQEGRLNFNDLEKQTEYLVNAGIHGLFICGGTGEGAYLRTEEKKDVIQAVKETADGKIFLCAALINSNTRAVLDELKAIEGCAPDYVVATAPYYHAASQKDIYEHYKIIAEQSRYPVIIYNIPSTTHNYIEPETIKRLSEIDNIAGVKDSSGNFMNFTRGLFGNTNDDFSWIQGEDYLCGATFLAGGDGAVSGLSNVRVEPYVEMYRAYQDGDCKKIKECQNRINKLYELIHRFGNGNAAIKAATELYGRGSRWMQIKSMSLDDDQMREAEKILDDYEKKRW